MSGADLANLANEAALLSARFNLPKVTMAMMEEAKDKIFMGPERKSRVIKEETKKMTAYHEAGHAIVGAALEYSDPVHKVTIIPRGRAGGLTFFLPEDDRDEVSRDWCLDTITQALGGRVAEQLVLKRMGTGAQQDIAAASKMARRMVMQWGMSSKLGPIAFVSFLRRPAQSPAAATAVGEGAVTVSVSTEQIHRRVYRVGGRIFSAQPPRLPPCPRQSFSRFSVSVNPAGVATTRFRRRVPARRGPPARNTAGRA